MRISRSESLLLASLGKTNKKALLIYLFYLRRQKKVSYVVRLNFELLTDFVAIQYWRLIIP
jgi:hypothetical protein